VDLDFKENILTSPLSFFFCVCWGAGGGVVGSSSFIFIHYLTLHSGSWGGGDMRMSCRGMKPLLMVVESCWCIPAIE